jgi:hypothetical protein
VQKALVYLNFVRGLIQHILCVSLIGGYPAKSSCLFEFCLQVNPTYSMCFSYKLQCNPTHLSQILYSYSLTIFECLEFMMFDIQILFFGMKDIYGVCRIILHMSLILLPRAKGMHY